MQWRWGTFSLSSHNTMLWLDITESRDCMWVQINTASCYKTVQFWVFFRGFAFHVLKYLNPNKIIRYLPTFLRLNLSLDENLSALQLAKINLEGLKPSCEQLHLQDPLMRILCISNPIIINSAATWGRDLRVVSRDSQKHSRLHFAFSQVPGCS